MKDQILLCHNDMGESIHSASEATKAASNSVAMLNESYIQQPFIITNPYSGFDEPKKWICKGKHQYRETNNSEWVCQCGKTLTTKTK